jgi:outer membrane protein assembly factor BamB
VDTRTTAGALRWSYHMHENLYSSPVVGADGTVYVGSSGGPLYALGPPASGTAGVCGWSYRLGSSRMGWSPAIGADGTVYIGSDDGTLYAIH